MYQQDAKFTKMPPFVICKKKLLRRHQICLDCRPLLVDENIPPGENYGCVYCYQSNLVQSFIGTNNRRCKSCNQYRVSKSPKFMFKY